MIKSTHKTTPKHNYVCVSGYGWSGSSACIDILKEFNGFSAPNGEFRIAKDPHGIRDLENSLVHNWDFIRHNVAIRDFLDYCSFLGRESGLLKKSGKGFSKKLSIDFMVESELYIEKLTSMNYIGNTSVHRYNLSAYKNFLTHVRGKFKKDNAELMRIARPTESNFLDETKKYINNLFCNYAKYNQASTIILDQAISPTNINNTIKYFDRAKIIIIDRDPRDIYINMVKRKKLLGMDLSDTDSAEKYILWHKKLRARSINDQGLHQHILRLNFEDLVFEYSQSIEKIMIFLGENANHSKKGKYFLPSYTIKNIGLWEKYENQQVMSTIADRLHRYCYNR